MNESQPEIHPVEDENASLQGQRMLGSDGDKVGKVTDVIYDEVSNEPRLLVVDPGLFKPSRFVPAHGAALTREGYVSVPYDRQLIKSSPRAAGDHVPSSHEIVAIEEHYGVARS